jgi:phosphohistidine phosphatase
MKRELFIVRHAKSSWELENISDIDRPLGLRGIRNAYEMARKLKIERNIPEKFITSPANRAMHTASIFINVFELSYEALKIDTRLYEQGSKEILEIIKSQPTELKKLMIFGHNPDFTQLAALFALKPIPDIPTCGMVVFEFDCKLWEDIGKDTLISEYLAFPNKE